MFDEWQSQSLDELTERFRQAGVSHDPQQWAQSEIDENLAQYARFVFLRSTWQLMLELHASCTALVTNTGTRDQDDLDRGFAQAIGRFTHQLLYLIGGDSSAFGHEQRDDEPSWRLVETIDEEATGRPILALYEDLWHTHPNGTDAPQADGWIPE